MKKVLVVDDALTVRLYHRQLMEAIGLEVAEAANGVEALEKGLSEPFDLLIADVNMPKMDGYRLLQAMRQDAGLRAIPVVMVSTESQHRDRQQAYAVGANAYVVKPADAARLQSLAVVLSGGDAV
ncbi:MAG: response regulator [Gammaproteobacteria bacterium]|nr:response regulator [Gammaproteobacteria bacterium]